MKRPKYMLASGTMKTMEDVQLTQQQKLQPTYVEAVEKSNRFWFVAGMLTSAGWFWVERLLNN